MNLRACAPVFACASAVLALSACGSSSSAPTTSSPAATSTPAKSSAPAKAGGAGATTVALQADPSGQLAYVERSLSAKAGKVTIDFTNQSPVPHDVAVDQGSKRLGAAPVINASTEKLTLTLAKGTYTFYCTVPGHRAQGMQGTLTVS